MFSSNDNSDNSRDHVSLLENFDELDDVPTTSKTKTKQKQNKNKTKTIEYRPEIDGLRCLAVVPVILYHYHFDILPGGFCGVDVFFVIS
eukprot:Pgem_evm1s10485